MSDTATDTPTLDAVEQSTALATTERPPSKIAGKAKAQREERATFLASLEYADQPAEKPFKRLSALQRPVLFLLLALALLQGISTFTTSYSGLYGAAAWAVGNQPFLQSIVPFMYDVAIIAFTVKLFMDREEGEKVRWTWFFITLLAFISAGANIIHTLVVSTATTFPQLVVGGIISGGSPFLLALTIEVAASKVFRRAVRND